MTEGELFLPGAGQAFDSGSSSEHIAGCGICQSLDVQRLVWDISNGRIIPRHFGYCDLAYGLGLILSFLTEEAVA